MQNFLRVKRAKGVVIKNGDVLLADWLNRILHIHEDYCWPEVLVCHFELFVVGARCVPFVFTREANSFL